MPAVRRALHVPEHSASGDKVDVIALQCELPQAAARASVEIDGDRESCKRPAPGVEDDL